jgi:hypothetical protein
MGQESQRLKEQDENVTAETAQVPLKEGLVNERGVGIRLADPGYPQALEVFFKGKNLTQMGLVYWPLHLEINGDRAIVDLRMRVTELDINAELRHIYVVEYENEVLDCIRQIIHEFQGCSECGTSHEKREISPKTMEWAERLAGVSEGKSPLHAKKEESSRP